jgi:hypothetical protein
MANTNEMHKEKPRAGIAVFFIPDCRFPGVATVRLRRLSIVSSVSVGFMVLPLSS